VRDVIVRFNALSQVCSNSFILVRTNNTVHGVVGWKWELSHIGRSRHWRNQSAA